MTSCRRSRKTPSWGTVSTATTAGTPTRTARPWRRSLLLLAAGGTHHVLYSLYTLHRITQLPAVYCREEALDKLLEESLDKVLDKALDKALPTGGQDHSAAGLA